MLHYVSDDSAYDALRPWNISCASFTRLLDYLITEGYQTLDFEDLTKFKKTPAKSVIITFDDCPKNLWDFAIPELLNRNMKAVFYMPTAHLGGFNEWNVNEGLPRLDLMGENDIAKLVSVGMEIGSHAHNHIMLEELSEKEVIDQLSRSKEIMEDIINKPVLSVAYPFGSVPCNAAAITKDIGYSYGLSVYTPWQTRYAIRRWIYDDTDTVETIRYKMSGRYMLKRALEDKYSYYWKKITRNLYRRYSRFKNIFQTNAMLFMLFVEDIQFV